MNSSLQWQVWQRLHPLYLGMAREFSLEAQPCAELNPPALDVSPEAFATAEQWFEELDGRIQVYHLRQFAQTAASMREESLRDLILHHLNKRARSERDRDKVDFLLVQLFSHRFVQSPRNAEPDVTTVAAALEDVIGPVENSTAGYVTSLDDLLRDAAQVQSLNAMFNARVIERGRELKATLGDSFFDPFALAAFARFGFVVRRTFFGLMQHDLNVILDGLRELESRGVDTLDCSKAQFSPEEPIARLRLICQSWRVMFQAEYSSGQPLCLLADLRTAVEVALAQPVVTDATPKVVSAAAASGGELEFDVAAGTHEPESEQS